MSTLQIPNQRRRPSLLAAGVISATIASAGGAAQARQPAALDPAMSRRPDVGLVVFVRDRQAVGSRIPTTVYVDDGFVAALTSGTYAFTHVSPGPHVIRIAPAKIPLERALTQPNWTETSGGMSSLRREIEGGAACYLNIHLTQGRGWSSNYEESEAIKTITGSQLALQLGASAREREWATKGEKALATLDRLRLTGQADQMEVEILKDLDTLDTPTTIWLVSSIEGALKSHWWIPRDSIEAHLLMGRAATRVAYHAAEVGKVGDATELIALTAREDESAAAGFEERATYSHRARVKSGWLIAAGALFGAAVPFDAALEAGKAQKTNEEMAAALREEATQARHIGECLAAHSESSELKVCFSSLVQADETQGER